MTQRLATVAATLILLSVWTHARPRAANVGPFDFSTAVPLAFGDWIGRDAPPLEPEEARILAADQYVHRYYGPRHTYRPRNANERNANERDENEPRTTNHGSRIEMDIAYYAQPQAGAAMHSPLNCLPGNGWLVTDSQVARVPAAGSAVDVRRLVVARGSDRVAMTYWFQNRGAVVGNEYRQRLQLLTNGLHGRPTDAALVRVMALDTKEGQQVLLSFTGELMAMLSAAFR